MAVLLHGRCEDDDDVYTGTDTSGIEVVAAGSVTSFVRKLFQMVQGECDSIVGFVEDGTAFEVKDPRRLEQDILPKYFRHSRFQSLVRQLNFYSFKKISKERSVWIYKHAFFRRDEPELLHALKRKTNQHGAPGPVGRVAIGGGAADAGDMMAARSPVADRSLSRDAHDNSKPRSRGPAFLPRHGAPGSDFPPQHHNPHPHHHPSPPSFSNHQHQYHNTGGRTHPRPPQHPLSAPRKSGGGGSGRMYHASSSRSTGGGPSTGGGAVPSRGGQGPSSRGGGGAPGGWSAGTGGRPVSSGGGQGGPGADYERRNGGGGSGGTAHHQAYRQGPAMGDTGGERGAPGQHGGSRGPGTGGAAVSSDKEQALAMWGLSALCQVASSATEAPLVGDEARGRETAAGASRRLPDDGNRQQAKRHRGAGPAARSRRGWGAHDESSGGDDEDDEDVTSAERDDSSSSIHRRSPSNSSCGSISGSSGSSGSSSSLGSSADSTHSSRPYGRRGTTAAANRGSNGGEVPATTTTTGIRIVSPQRASGSGGVFCPTWDWGRAACEPAIRLPGSFVDRRFEEVDEQVGDGVDMDDVEEESSKTEEEDMGDDENEEAPESDDGVKKAAWRGEHITGPAEVSPPLAEPRSTVPVPATTTAPATVTCQQRDLKADVEAETEAGLEGIGALFSQFCSGEDGSGGGGRLNTNASTSVFLATVTDSGDGGLREMAVFCAGPAGRAPDEAPPASLVRQVSLFLQGESAVAQDLRVYAEALDPAAVDVVVGRTNRQWRRGGEGEGELSTDGAKLLRVFCRYAACRLGRALEVASCAAAAAVETEAPPAGGGGSEDAGDDERAARQMLLRQSAVAQRITPRLDECRWKWWRAAVRFS